MTRWASERLGRLFPATVPRAGMAADDPASRRLRFEVVNLCMTVVAAPLVLSEAFSLHGAANWGVSLGVPLWLTIYSVVTAVILRRYPRHPGALRLLAVLFTMSSVYVPLLLWVQGGPQQPVWLGYVSVTAVMGARWQFSGAMFSLIPFYISRALTNFSYTQMTPAARTQEIALEFFTMTTVTVVVAFLFRELEHARRRLRESHATLEATATRLSTVLGNVAEAIVTIDEHDVVTSANRACGDLFATPPEELVGLAVENLLAMRRIIVNESTHGPSSPHGATTRHQASGQQPDGRTLLLDLQITTIAGDSGPIRIVLARDVTTERLRSAELHEANARLARNADDLNELAADRQRLLTRTFDGAEQERTRIALELHDGPIQRLTAAAYGMDRIHRRVVAADGAAPLVEMVVVTRDRITAEIDSLRRIMSALRPPVLDHAGLEGALRDWAVSVKLTSGIPCDVTVDLDAGLIERDTATALYRITQEALANATEHSRATRVGISLRAAGAGLALVITDDGIGFDPIIAAGLMRYDHFGLAGIQQRAAMIGAKVDIASTSPGGTTITITAPDAFAPKNEEAGAPSELHPSVILDHGSRANPARPMPTPA